MNREKQINFLICAGVSAPVVMLVGCISVGAGIAGDSMLLQILGSVLAVVSLLAIVAGMSAAFSSKKIAIGLGGLVGIAICTGLGFYTAIGIAAGQHHPLRREVENTDSTNVFIPAVCAEALSGQLEEDSWWTNGYRYFRVAKTGGAYSLEGMTLHEGGMEALLESRGDSLSLWVASPRSGMSSFASTGCKVQRYRYRLSDADPEAAIELLIAYDKEDLATPVSALQRFDGDELQYETAGIHALLEGVFTDDNTEWTLLPDGTIKLAADAQAKPYRIECCYHMPTNVVRLPDGRHVALQLADDDALLVLEAHYDADEEVWEEAEPRKVLMQLPRKHQTPRRDMAVLEGERLVTPAMLTFMDGDIDDVVRRYSSLDSRENPVGTLNIQLLRHWQYTQENDLED